MIEQGEPIPLNGEVFVEYQDRKEEKTASGLHLQHQFQGIPNQGTVLKIGDGCQEVEKGDRVIYDERSPRVFEHEGKKIVVVKEENIQAVIQNAEEPEENSA